MIERYYATSQRLRLDPSVDIAEIDLVAAEPDAIRFKQSIAQGRAEGYTTTGALDVEVLRSKLVTGKEKPTVLVTVCVDRTDFVVKDAQGQRIGDPTKMTSESEMTVEDWGHQWYVTTVESEPADC